MHQSHHPFAAIATAEAVAVWLDGLELGGYANAFREREWHGEALLDALDEPGLAEVIADAADRERLSVAVRRLLRQAMRSEPAMSAAQLNAPAAACRQLGADWSRQPWLATLVDTWPGPIAHEAHALGQLLATGNAAAALWQLRDLAEVLIKLPTAILAAEAERRDPDGALAAIVHDTLYGRMPAMGTWRTLLCDELAPGLLDAAYSSSAPPALRLVRLVLDAKGKPTPFAQALRDQVALRNREGHGAWRHDQTEIVAALRHWLLGDLPRQEWARIGMDKHPKPMPLAEGLRFAVAEAPWSDLTLAVRMPDSDNVPLVGAPSIPDHRDDAAENGLEPAPVLLQQRGAEPLDLAPHLAARICALCGYRDIFFVNGHDRRAHRFDLLDYRRGHRMSRHWHQVPDLHRHAARRPLPPLPAADTGPLALGRASTLALFDTLAFEARYLSPDWLRAPLRDFIAANDRGVLWLQAPGHVGKSLFVHGLQANLDDQPLLPGEPLRVAAVFIRREYSYGPARLLPLLEAELKRSLDLADDNERRLPRIDEQATDKPATLAAGLAAYRQLARARTGFDGPLLICLDGLDELRPPDADGSLLDFIPSSDTLPERTYLLLTSRPLDAEGCPRWVRERTDQLRRSGLESRAADLNDPGYRGLLRAYFDREFATVAAHLEAAALATGTNPTAARATAAERLDALYQAIVEKANGLFLYLAFLIDRIHDQSIPADPAAIHALPARSALFHGYLEQLQDELGPKHADLALTLLLTLAATERAHAWLIAQPEWPPELDQTWHGLALDVLARLTHQTGAEAELLYVVLRLRSVLGTWRAGTSASAHYRLGVRGLTEAVKEHPEFGPRLMATHRRLADEALALAADAPATVSGEAQQAVPIEQSEAMTKVEDEPVRTLLLRQALAHASLGGDTDQGDAVAGNRRLIGFIHAEAETRHRAMELPAAIVSNTCCLLHARHMARTGDVVWRNDLASAYNNRGNAKRSASGHGPAAAIADYDAAIAIGEAVRQLLEPAGHWEVSLRNALATAYMNRGVAKQSASGHGPAAAIADYDAAIAIMEAVRQLLEPEGRWEVGLRNNLARAYMNRGNAKQSASGHGPAAALADYDAAIAIGEAVRQLLEPEGRWEVNLRNDLAHAYNNRGNAKQSASGHGPAAALADYDAAIAIREAVRQLLEPEGRWEVDLRNDLASAYMNRGNAKQSASGHGPAAAIADYDAAIAIGEAVRQLLEPEGRWEVDLRNDLARAYVNRGNAKQSASGHGPAAAIADYDAAIAIMEAVRQLLEPEGRWEVDLRNDLASAYNNRGTAKQSASGHGPAAAIADYDAAIAIGEAVRQLLEPEGRWEVDLRNDLARAYNNRGLAKQSASGHGPAAALADYDAAIAIREAVRQLLEPEGRWEVDLRNDLAGAYSNRGNAKQSASGHGPAAAALADYDAAIAIGEAVRQLLEPAGHWEVSLRNALATAYMNRGVAKRSASGHGPAAALADYDAAIAIGEAVRQLLEPEGRWEVDLRNDLARAYVNRGNAKQSASGHGPAAAIADYDAAIAIGEAVRQLLEPEGRWEVDLRNDLASAYMNRGNAKQSASGHGPAAAIADYDAAIAIREAVRQLLEPEGRWEVDLRNALANAYMNRGIAKRSASGHGPAAALADYDAAIAIGEAVRQLLAPEGRWEVDLRNDLANAYMSRGIAKRSASGHGPAAAIADHDAAIAIGEAVRQLLEPEGRWEVGLRNDLANAYMSRGNAKQSASGHGPAAAIADYDAAIAIGEAVRQLLEPEGRWEVELRNALANAYMNRGTAKQSASGHGPAAAIADYDAAIAIMEAVRQLLEPEGRWEVELRNALANAYMNRGNAKQSASGHGPAAAIADHDAAIAIREAVRQLLEPAGRWEVGLRNDLANAYMNRGNAKQSASGHGPAAAIADYDAAIAIGEAVRQLLEPAGHWEVSLRNALATAYMNRGVAKQSASGHGPAAAIADYDAAIAIMEAVRQLLEPEGRWEVGLRNNLARAYSNRGGAKQSASGHGPAAALADYDAAIAIGEAVRQLLEPEGRWEVNLRNDLARAYVNRGNAKQSASGHGPAAAIADHDAAIAIMEAVRQLLEPAGRWEVGLRNDLARAYVNRGNAKQSASGHGPAAAIADYDAAIAIGEGIRDLLLSLGGKPPLWSPWAQVELAQWYLARIRLKGAGHSIQDQDAVRSIADDLAATGQQPLATGLIYRLAMAKLPRPVLWAIERLLRPFAGRI